MNYQSHKGLAAGMSDSAKKLNRIRFPVDLKGRSFLDVGCNEGFFCNVAKERGAARVVGIDYDSKALAIAKDLYSGPEFIHSSWRKLPPGPFDVVLWSSAMHYELDPVKVFREIHYRLKQDGVFILECGALDRGSKEMVLVKRHGDTRYYPTLRLLIEELLKDFAVRIVSYGELTPGDPVPRFVFHCQKRQPTVLVIRGETKLGKSSLSDLLIPSATKVIQMDVFVNRLARGDFQHGDLQKMLKENFEKSLKMGLQWLYDEVDKKGHTGEFAKYLANTVAETDALIVIEGAISALLFEALKAELNGRARVWQAIA